MDRDYSAELQALMPEIYSVFNKAIKIIGDHKLEMDRAKEGKDVNTDK